MCHVEEGPASEIYTRIRNTPETPEKFIHVVLKIATLPKGLPLPSATLGPVVKKQKGDALGQPGARGAQKP